MAIEESLNVQPISLIAVLFREIARGHLNRKDLIILVKHLKLERLQERL
jgi:hypothetical protein